MIADAIKQAQKVHRELIESTYSDTCTIVEYKEITRPNKSTGFDEVPVLLEQPCKLSYKSISSVMEGSAATITQVAKLFIAPEVTVNPGSKVIVAHEGATTEYAYSGKPAMYSTHQEIILELFKEWT